MLNLSVETRQLTQGQPPAQMTLAVQRQEPAAGAPSQQTGPAAPAAAPAGPTTDPRAVARRVYDLMRQELVVHRDRCGPRKL